MVTGPPDDNTTLTVGRVELGGDDRAVTHVPALTILWHPDLKRVGELAPLPDVLTGTPVAVTRRDPRFALPGATDHRGIEHECLSRDPVFILSQLGGHLGLELGPGAARLGGGVEVGGQPLVDFVPLRPEDIRAGAIITAGYCVFCLHSVAVPLTRSPTLGLLGVGDAIEQVRRHVARTAASSATVLIRGESGSGKELVAKALHENSPRRTRPFVIVNMATVLADRANADLFGYERGAYTGAAAPAPGYFRAADGGTLFLDEIGKLDLGVQRMLLRVLEDFQVQPLGASQPRSVDVRVIAATDANLEQMKASGTFDGALYNRLMGGIVMSVPPLRERREDIGLIFAHYLREALGPAGAHRLTAEPSAREEWLPAPAVAAICRHPLPGNVRILKGLAANIPRQDRAFKYIVEELRKAGLPAGAAPAGKPRLNDMSLERVIDILDEAGWNISEAARRIGVEPSTLQRRLRKAPHLHALTTLSIPELERRLSSVGGDVAALARQLSVPEELLLRRLRRG